VPEDSLRGFPEAFRAGMAARAGPLLDNGENDPARWDAPFGRGLIHIGVSVFGVPLPMPQPDVLGRNGTFAGLRKYQSRVGTFNRFLHEHAGTEQERELLAAKLVGRWRSGAPLTLAPDRDDPALGADPRRNNDFGYAADPDGRHVPLGSHMRRMNPREKH